jgi:hypothetical protein
MVYAVGIAHCLPSKVAKQPVYVYHNAFGFDAVRLVLSLSLSSAPSLSLPLNPSLSVSLSLALSHVPWHAAAGLGQRGGRARDASP